MATRKNYKSCDGCRAAEVVEVIGDYGDPMRVLRCRLAYPILIDLEYGVSMRDAANPIGRPIDGVKNKVRSPIMVVNAGAIPQVACPKPRSERALAACRARR